MRNSKLVFYLNLLILSQASCRFKYHKFILFESSDMESNKNTRELLEPITTAPNNAPFHSLKLSTREMCGRTLPFKRTNYTVDFGINYFF